MENQSREKEFNLALKNNDIKKIKNIFDKTHKADIAIFINEINNVNKLNFILNNIDNSLIASLFVELNSKTQKLIINLLTIEKLTQIFNKIFIDDLVDIIKKMPTNIIYKILKSCSKERKEEIKNIINYKDDVAGSIMTTEFIELNDNVSVKNAINYIRKIGKQSETIYTIFIKNEQNKFIGVCNLEDLIFANSEDQTLNEIKHKELLYVNADTDREKVVQIFKKYDLTTLAVINKKMNLIGIITVDDIMDAAEKETNEDIELQAGVIPLNDEYQNVNAFKMALKYAPWLIILIVFDVFSGMIISKCENRIREIIVLATFIPVVMDTSGNSGGQTCSVIIRYMSLKELSSKDFFKIFLKELKTSFFTGFIVAITSFIIFVFEMFIGLIDNNDAKIIPIAIVVSITLFFSIVIAKFFGCAIPFIAKKLKKDPAIISEPFVTTLADFSALIIYFSIVTLLTNFIK